LIKQKLFGYEVGKLEAALKQYNLDIPFNNFDQWAQFEVLIETDEIINNIATQKKFLVLTWGSDYAYYMFLGSLNPNLRSILSYQIRICSQF